MFAQFELPRALTAIGRFTGSFLRKEEGALTIFGLLILVMMMIAGGVALDMMRSEADRTRLQYTMDRAVLAAAALEQEGEAVDVVKAYLRAAGIPESDVRISTVDNGSSKRVSIRSDATTDSLFMNVLGHDQVVVPVSAQAAEEESELEVSLVVDISGSMGGDKIANLRTAASSFVAELLLDREHLTSISVVPYNDRVNVGSTLAGYLPLSTEHTHSNCVVFDDDAFSTTGLEAGTVLQRMSHFDPWSGATNAPGLVSQPLCRTDDYGAILPWSNSVTQLQTHIGALGAGWNTAMDLGVKWGAMLLDPSMQSVLSEMADDGLVSEDMRGRPFPKTHANSRKVLVVMTDGYNTSQWDIVEDMKDAPSGVFIHNPNVEAPSIEIDLGGDGCDGLGNLFGIGGGCGGGGDDDDDDGNGTHPASGISNWNDKWVYGIPPGIVNVLFGGQSIQGWWQSAARGNWTDFDVDEDGDGVASASETKYSTWSESTGSFYVTHLNQYQSTPFGGEDAVELTYSELFSAMSIDYIDQTLLSGADWDTRDKFYYAWETTQNNSSANTNLSNICAAARNAGIRIYTIAFQAPDDGVTAMKGCAGTGNEANFFDVKDLDVDSAFDDILASINRLRLTQ